MSTISSGTTSTTTLIHSGDTTGSLVFKTNDTGSGGTTAMTIDTSQNVGIGTSSPTNGKLVITGSSVTTAQGIRLTGDTADARFICESASIGAGILGTFSNHAQLFYTNSTERMRIDSSGNLLVGTTSQGANTSRVWVYGASGAGSPTIVSDKSASGSVGSNHLLFNNSNGFVGSITTSGSATAYNTSSDYRLKENVQPMTGALATVAQLKPVTYDWISDKSKGQGFIAHELQAVVPDCVTGAKDAIDAEGNPIYQGVDTSFLVATLVASIQELKAINDQQAQTITALTARIEALENK